MANFFRQFLQTFTQHAVLRAQCIHQFPAALACGQVIAQAPCLVYRQFTVDEDGACLFRVTFHDYMLP
jgi:hypothetical protein